MDLRAGAIAQKPLTHLATTDSAPFLTSQGCPYLEPHHIRRLSDGGPDDPRWVVALCPNCHRRAHYATDHSQFNHSLTQIIDRKENSLLN